MFRQDKISFSLYNSAKANTNSQETKRQSHQYQPK